MAFVLEIKPHTLQFKFSARTSRGAMQQHQVYYLKLYEEANKDLVGIGECAPLPGLSPDYSSDYFFKIKNLLEEVNVQLAYLSKADLNLILQTPKINLYPSFYFALETALLDLQAGGNRILYQNSFSQSRTGIPINGLIWMGDKAFMQSQIKAKLQEGYACLKLKIGGLDFETELAILSAIRAVASAKELTIRLDANGAFGADEAREKLNRLAVFDIHSLEQPIKAGQWQEMQQVCLNSPIPIALDEELIGITELEGKTELLDYLKPAYIIFKPTLLGGFAATADWIRLAGERKINWWITSALESNIGLNAISQFTAEYPVEREQGLGTGQLYHNNIPSPLKISNGHLYYDKNQQWDLELINS